MSVSYRPLEAYPGYLFGSDGSVLSFRTKCTGKIRERSVPLRLEKMRSGHIRVTLSNNKKLVRRFVHNLVLEAFVGPAPDGMECCHNDGNPSNNHVENLRWDTHKSNMQDRIRHNTLATGMRNGNRKLTESQVSEIRRRIASESASKLASDYGISNVAVYNIVSRKVWKHIS